METTCTNCFSGLGVKARMGIYLYLKRNGPKSVSGLVDLVQLTQPTVSYHLKEMKKVGLLNSEKKGKEVYYSINELCPVHKELCVLNSVEFKNA